MGKLSCAALIPADKLDSHQRNVWPLVVVEIIHALNFRGGGQLINIQLVLVLPMHMILEHLLFHKRERYLTK